MTITIDLRPPRDPGRRERGVPRLRRRAPHGQARVLRARLHRTRPPDAAAQDERRHDAASSARPTSRRSSRSRRACSSSSGPTACAATSWPTSTPSAATSASTTNSTRPATASRSGTSTGVRDGRRRHGRRRARRARRAPAPRDPRRAVGDLHPPRRHRVHAHLGPDREAVAHRADRAAADDASRSRSSRSSASSTGSTPPRRSSGSSTRSTSATSASRLEGAETLIPILDQILSDAADQEVDEAVIGMAHRGRLNVLANVMGKPYSAIFGEFEGNLDIGTSHGSGDVKYHLGAHGTHTAPSGTSIDLTLAGNPSHLEAVNPVVEGMVRAKQQQRGDIEPRRGAAPSSSTATPRSPGRASSPRRSTSASSTATRPAARSTSSSTTRSGSRRSRCTRARRPTPPTSRG